MDGILTAIEAESIIEWQTVTLREPSGKELRFSRGSGVDLRFWRASHIREHILNSDRVTVTYRQAEGGLVAESLVHEGEGQGHP